MKTSGINEKFSYYGKLMISHISQFASEATNSQLILDVGCGDLRYSKELAKNTNILVIATDIDPSLMRNLRSQKLDNIYKIACDATKLPFRDNIFDGITNINVLHHLPTLFSLTEVVSEFRRVSKKNVRLFIKENVSNNPFRSLLKKTYCYVPASIKEVTVVDNYEREHVSHLLYFSTEDLLNTLTRTGFNVTKKDRQELFMFFAYYFLLVFPFLKWLFPDFMTFHLYNLERSMLARFPFRSFNQSVTIWATLAK